MTETLQQVEKRLQEKIRENRDAALSQHKETKNSIDELTNLLKGTLGKPGLVTKVILNCTSITRLWWFVGLITMFLLGILGKAVFF